MSGVPPGLAGGKIGIVFKWQFLSLISESRVFLSLSFSAISRFWTDLPQKVAIQEASLFSDIIFRIVP